MKQSYPKRVRKSTTAAEAEASSRAAAALPDGDDAVYGARPIKRRRRTRAELERLRAALYEIIEANKPVTVRQAFYLAVVAGLVEKTQAEYKNSVGRQLLIMRQQRELPYEWIADNTRWMRKPRSYSSLSAALEDTARVYRRNLWDDQDVYVEVWTEKDALAGVLLEETRVWDVPLMVSRGFASETYLYEAAEAIRSRGKPAYLYYYGDFDPSGVHIDRNIEKGLRRLAPDADIHFERVAVLPEQIRVWDLPTRPLNPKDKRKKSFEGGECVEVDAIPPLRLRGLVRDCIERHVDQDALRVVRAAEASERQVLRRLISTYEDADEEDSDDGW